MAFASRCQVLCLFFSISTCLFLHFNFGAATSLLEHKPAENSSVSAAVSTKTGLECYDGRQAQEGEALDKEKWKYGTKTIVCAALIGATLLVFAVSVVVLCLRCRRKKPKSSQKHRTAIASRVADKVSFDSGPELFYMNSLSQLLDNKSSVEKVQGSRNVLLKPEKYETLPCSERNVSHSPSSSSSFSPFSSSNRSISPDLDLEKQSFSMPSPCENKGFSCADVNEESHSPSVPLFCNGNGGRIPKPPQPPLPPVPPGRVEHCKPVSKEGSPLPKLKPLHWDKVRPASNHSTVWDNIRSKSFEFDEEMIELLFGYNGKCLTRNEEVRAKNPSPGLPILELKRLQNITILLKALTATIDDVHDALVLGLCVEQLEVLLKVMPTKIEEEKLVNYAGDINNLASAEKFLKAMLEIPFAFLRIKVMLYKQNFDEDVCHLKETFKVLEDACKELRTSRHFLKLLKAVLKAGNRMNVGTMRGGATAFKLDCLLRLADIKGTDGKITLLHFVVQEMIRAENVTNNDAEECSQMMAADLMSILNSELQRVKKSANLDLDDLANAVLNLSNGMNEMKHLLQEGLCMYEDAWKFVNSMKPFLDYAEVVIKELKDSKECVLVGVKEITEYYHGHVSKKEANSLQIFVIIRDFLELLDRECKS
ncbi:Formin FH2 domain-containing protein [Dioscorea alata]|uniref:Formin FH2 domain-containing protein n=1 Tax=Dioscorea alata TaxID=55571 RepID=A0ACB7U6L3_DIOAL|nr:Formin FH2 domain-containing protein [Dioscorea alata]